MQLGKLSTDLRTWCRCAEAVIHPSLCGQSESKMIRKKGLLFLGKSRALILTVG